MAKRGRVKREGTWHVLTLRVFQTAYDNTAGEEDSPATWDWPTLLDKRYDDVELLGSVVDEDQEHHITDWDDDAHMTTGTAGLPAGLDQKLHEILTSDPRGCEHPVGMSPQCERVARRLAFMAASERPVVVVDGKPDMDATYEERARRGRVTADPDLPIN